MSSAFPAAIPAASSRASRQVQNQVRMVTVREESLAGVMAEVYGRLTRRPGVMLGQGPWVLGNGLIGTLEAYLSSSPMLLLTDFSDAPRFHLHAPYQQATGDYGSWDARRAFGGVTKQVMQAQEPIAAVQATQLAIKHALAGQPGPVAILFSHDSLAGTVAPDSQPALYPTRFYLPPPPPPADPAQIEAAAERILAAAQAGHHRRQRRAHRAGLRANCASSPRLAGLPVATTAAGKGCFPETHPLALGVFGTFGTAAANACIGEADLVLVVGSKLSPSDTAWENGKLLDPTRQSFIQIDIEPRNASWNFPAEQVVLGDAAMILGQLREAVRAKRRATAAPRPSSASPAIATRTAISTRRPTSADDKPILPQRVIGELMRNLPDDAIVTCDAGENRILMTHFYQTKTAGGFLQAAGSGPMGFAIPAALAAKLVHPDRPVVAVCGDGGFAMTMNGHDDRDRARHPDHRRSCSTTRRSAGCCTAAGRSPPSSTISTTPRSPARWAAAARGSRSRRIWRPRIKEALAVAQADRDRRAHLARRPRSPTSPRRWPTRPRRGGASQQLPRPNPRRSAV